MKILVPLPVFAMFWVFFVLWVSHARIRGFGHGLENHQIYQANDVTDQENEKQEVQEADEQFDDVVEPQEKADSLIEQVLFDDFHLALRDRALQNAIDRKRQRGSHRTWHHAPHMGMMMPPQMRRIPLYEDIDDDPDIPDTSQLNNLDSSTLLYIILSIMIAFLVTVKVSFDLRRLKLRKERKSLRNEQEVRIKSLNKSYEDYNKDKILKNSINFAVPDTESM